MLVYSSNKDRVLKNRPNLDWLFDGEYRAELLDLSPASPKGFNPSGGIKGSLIIFKGIWRNGSFKGVMMGGNSSISGGRIIDGIFISQPDSFQISPWNFWSGGFSPMKGFVMGMPTAKDNTKYKKISLAQVPSEKIIKIIDNNDQEHILTVEKGINITSLDFIINGQKVDWINYTKDKASFEKSFMVVGKNFMIPDIGFEIDKGIQSIEIKTLDYSPKNISVEKESPEKAPTEDVNKFKIKTKEKGWTPGGKGYYNLDIDTNDNDLIESISKFKNDINSGKFFNYLNFFKRIIKEGRVDGYGKFPSLAFIFPNTIGVNYKNDDKKRDAVMKYFSDFRENVIDNFSSQNISEYYINLVKKYIDQKSTPPKNKTKKKTAVKSSRPKINEEKLSFYKIISKIL